MRGKLKTIAGLALLAASAATTAAVPKPAAPAASGQPPATKALIEGCELHRFETVIHMTGPDGKPRESKVRMCGTVGQSDADWIRTLKDAVTKTAENPQMPRTAKDQIIAAVNAEIDRLSMSTLQLPAGTGIGKLPAGPDIKSLPKTASKSAPDVPLSRDYGSLPPLPTASSVPTHVLGPGADLTPAPRLTLRCALVGDEDRPGQCDSIDKDTILVLRADEAFPRGVEMRFVRHGDQRAELALPAMKEGDRKSLHLPPGVCTGVVRSKLEIQALGASAPKGATAGTIGEYDLHC
jgi:hypothetical protein